MRGIRFDSTNFRREDGWWSFHDVELMFECEEVQIVRDRHYTSYSIANRKTDCSYVGDDEDGGAGEQIEEGARVVWSLSVPTPRR